MSLETFDSFIFDLDGTLWDTSIKIDHSWNKALERFAKLRSPFSLADILGIMGKHHSEILADLFPDAPQEEADACLAECYIEHQADILENNAYALYDDAGHVINQLAKTRRVFLVSNCDQPYLDLFLQKFSHSSDFEATLCHGATGKDKAWNIKHVIDKANLQAAVYIGDTATDEAAAKAAGIPFIFAEYGFGQASNADFSIASLKELL
jgi:phosphoglycolate phosphatase